MDAASIEEDLVAERERARRRLASLHGDFASIVAASEQSNADDEHDPEGATIAFERAQVQALARQARQRVDDAEAALARLHDGSYGVCMSCGRAIPDERLAVRPTALTCVSCA